VEGDEDEEDVEGQDQVERDEEDEEQEEGGAAEEEQYATLPREMKRQINPQNRPMQGANGKKRRLDAYRYQESQEYDVHFEDMEPGNFVISLATDVTHPGAFVIRLGKGPTGRDIISQPLHLLRCMERQGDDEKTGTITWLYYKPKKWTATIKNYEGTIE
jgi:hypothetical protein